MGKYASRNAQGDHRIGNDDPKTIKLLKDEHHVFRTLFDKANAAQGSAMAPIANELCMRLTIHMTLEEELLYPAARTVGDAHEVDEGIVEHAAGKDLIAEIEQLDGTEELYKSKVHVLGEQTIHHIDEEDEELFEEVKAAHAAGKIDLDALGDTMRARQKQLYDEVAQTGEIGQTDEAEVEEIPTA